MIGIIASFTPHLLVAPLLAAAPAGSEVCLADFNQVHQSLLDVESSFEQPPDQLVVCWRIEDVFGPALVDWVVRESDPAGLREDVRQLGLLVGQAAATHGIPVVACTPPTPTFVLAGPARRPEQRAARRPARPARPGVRGGHRPGACHPRRPRRPASAARDRARLRLPQRPDVPPAAHAPVRAGARHSPRRGPGLARSPDPEGAGRRRRQHAVAGHRRRGRTRRRRHRRQLPGQRLPRVPARPGLPGRPRRAHRPGQQEQRRGHRGDLRPPWRRHGSQLGAPRGTAG